MKLSEQNSTYYIDYYYQNRRKRERVGPYRKVAERALAKRLTQVAENRFLDKREEQQTLFKALAEAYLEKHLKLNCSKGWARKERVNLDRLARFFGDRRLQDITPMMVEQFKAERLKEVAPATVNKALACLKAMFNKASDWGLLDGKNPVSKVKLLKVDNKRLRYLEKPEIARLIGNCLAHLKPIVILALNTGMRKSEIFNLRWDDVDFNLRMIQLLKTKNNKIRNIPMNESVYYTLKALKEQSEDEQVFPGRNGPAITYVTKSFATALRKSGIINFRFHDLRHTFASQLVMAGVDLNTVRELLGHSELTMTLRYAHLSCDHKRQAVQVLGDWGMEKKLDIPHK
ncbi:MAG: site-specific integrase [Candidatus Omnitrophica bacterium]|nr:site-specific integrase [Candidatus Omnitrophota bacterium]